MRRFVLMATWILLFSWAAQASVDYQLVGSLGQTKITGDLADENSLSSGFGFNLIPDDGSFLPENLLAFLSLNFLSTESTYRGSSLSFTDGQKMSVNKMELAPFLCLFSSPRFQPACLGVGYSLIYYRQTGKNQEARGELSLNYQLRFHVWKGVGAGISSNWISSQGSSDNGDNWSGLWTNAVFVGYTL